MAQTNYTFPASATAGGPGSLNKDVSPASGFPAYLKNGVHFVGPRLLISLSAPITATDDEDTLIEKLLARFLHDLSITMEKHENTSINHLTLWGSLTSANDTSL